MYSAVLRIHWYVRAGQNKEIEKDSLQNCRCPGPKRKTTADVDVASQLRCVGWMHACRGSVHVRACERKTAWIMREG